MEPKDRFIREPECAAISGLGDMQRRRLEAVGKFPMRVKLNPDGGPKGAVGWSYREVMDWLEARRASRAKAA